ncbi:MAG: GDP-mannose 4,6-dehydratase, partial [Candidatus Riflebacteria bacterium]|nr:GDP-mannose 4,6-dehydratase [Candidatus Riflebacteria bacterium]
CSFGLPITIVRPFNTFGPRQSMRAVIPTIITQALKGKNIKLGDTKPVRDFNFVLNTCEGFIAAALNGKSNAEIYNISSGEEHSIGETASLIAEIMGAKLVLTHDPQRNRPSNSEVMRLLGDSSKAKAELGWTPHYSFKEGLTQTIHWFEKNIDKYKDIGTYKS